MVIDASASGIYKLTPEQISAELRRGDVSMSETDEGLYLAIVLTPNPEWEKIGSMKPE